MISVQEGDAGFFDEEFLDNWTIPFGSWVDQMVDWIDLNVGWLLDAIRWPFQTLADIVINKGAGPKVLGLEWNGLVNVSWVWCVLFTFLLGSLVRNVKVGVMTSAALALCGLLGPGYWVETIRTIGMVLVAVVVCALIGVPLGILCGRIDSVWNVVRPVLDAMQVVHAFVYMLPIIFFFSIGVVPGIMVTMVFALPPLIRLTNLGIRQVPEDVVEASRAYGAPELRVLIDVQVPLARPAIMTGLNQTLLLAISMIGIAALMGAGGLGLLVFRAVQNLDTALAAAAGLALFLVAVILDRISQPEADDGLTLAGRIKRAWANRKTPELLLEGAGTADLDAESGSSTDRVVVESAEKAGEQIAPATADERRGLGLAALGAALVVVSVLLTWGNDSGLISGHSRDVDIDLAGQSFNGIDASGGSWFGIFALLAAVFVISCAVVTISRPAGAARYISTDGALVASTSIIVLSAAYLLAAPTDTAPAYSDGIGPWLALTGGIIATAGAAMAIRTAPYSPQRPLSTRIGWARLIGAMFAVVVIFVGSISGWSFDRRESAVVDPALQAEIDALIQEAEDDPSKAVVNSSIISALTNEAKRTGVVVNDGFNDRGVGLGPLGLIAGLIAVLLAIPAIGLLGRDEHKRWRWSAAVVGVGTGVMLFALAFILSFARVTDPGMVSGTGAFITVIGGFVIIVTSRGTLDEFQRKKVYDDDITDDAVGAESAKLAEEVGAPA